MHFSSLETLSLEEIRTCFNEAFKEYLVPVHLTPEQLAQKLRAEGYAPELSVAALDGPVLAGLILHARGNWQGKQTAYNAGTGVLPAYRGQHLSQRMYAYVLPILKQRGFQSSLLEVIKGNERALRTYQAVGFGIVRELDSFKGTVSGAAPQPEVRRLGTPDWQQLQHLWSWQPSWQHSPACLQRAAESYHTYALMEQGAVLAYATINPLTSRIPSFAVAPAHRRRGLALRLFRHLQHCHPDKPLTVINVAASASDTTAFLQAAGLYPMLRQYEMELSL